MLVKGKVINDYELSSQIYFKEISKFKSLSLDEELSLWERYKKYNDLKAKEKIITSNLKFVASVAKNFQGRGLSFSDLIAEGNYGLLKAIEKFDYNKKYKTISYSVWWIRQTILEAIKERNNIKDEDLPCEYEKQNYYLNEEDSSYNVIPKRNNNFIDENSNYYEEEKQNELKKIINELTKGLNNKEKNILIKYYGLDDTKPLTLEEIGLELNLTKERVRQILVKIFKEMRAEALNLNITSYL